MSRRVLLFVLFFPSLVTWIYFVALADAPTALQQSAYTVGKTIQFVFPVYWVLLVRQRKLRWTRLDGGNLLAGLVFGLLVSGAMLALYHLWLKPAGFFAGPGEAIREKVAGLGLDSAGRFIALGTFYALCHSLLEEYYWRWFVFRRLRDTMSMGGAVVVSSLGFMAHHVILLATYFGWTSPVTYLFALGVAVGGAVWAIIYSRGPSLLGPWLSHCLVDAAIFVIGFDLASSLLE